MKTFRVTITVSGEIDLTFEASNKKVVERQIEKIKEKLIIDPKAWDSSNLVEVGEGCMDYDFEDIEVDE